MKPAATQPAEIAIMAAENETLRRELARLGEIIDHYAGHHVGCDLAQPTCSCGLRTALRKGIQ